jgi:hypothetical protein
MTECDEKDTVSQRHLLLHLVDIRAKGTEERTREYVLEGMKKVQQAFKEHDLIANVRLETYEGPRYFHVPPPQEQ